VRLSFANSATSMVSAAGTGVAPANGMLKRLGTRLLDLIDNMPLGWLGGPFRRMTPVPVRRSRSPYYR
jgi:hypothetical protein